MALERDLALGDERFGDVGRSLAHRLALLVHLRLRQVQPGNDDQNWRARAEPEQGAPAVARRVDQSAREDNGQEVAEGVALLHHARNDATGGRGAVFESRCGHVAVQAAHGDTKECADPQELRVVVAETGGELQHNEEDVIHYKGPLASPTIRGDTERDGPDRAQHEH